MGYRALLGHRAACGGAAGVPNTSGSKASPSDATTGNVWALPALRPRPHCPLERCLCTWRRGFPAPRAEISADLTTLIPYTSTLRGLFPSVGALDPQEVRAGGLPHAAADKTTL